MPNTKPQLVDVTHHHQPRDLSDRVALGFTKLLRAVADGFFAKRYGHRAIVLETVAAVLGMVGASMTHLRCLRRMCDDQGWIRILMEEAENERMHLMTFIEVAQPSAFERFLIIAVQWVFYIGFLALYLTSPATAINGGWIPGQCGGVKAGHFRCGAVVCKMAPDRGPFCQSVSASRVRLG